MLAAADLSDLDHGPRAKRLGTTRMCAVSRQVRPIDELIRFVVAPTGDVMPDLKRRLPGRGLWVSASREAVAEAVRRHHFNRGFKREVRVAASLASDTEILIERGVQDALAIAAKAGQAVSGFTRVEAVLAERAAIALIHASDAAADGVRKLDSIARQAHGGDDGQIPIVTALTSAQLDLALGRSNVIHAALLAGSASETFLSRSHTLVRYRVAASDIGGAANKADSKRPVRSRTTQQH